METLNRDVLFMLGLEMDTRTLIVFCNTYKLFNEKICNDENFWKAKLKKDYPLLIRFKEELQSWKQFYLEMVYFIDKIFEKYKISYIPAEAFDPKEFYQLNWPKQEALNEALYLAVTTQDLSLVKDLIRKGAKDFNGAMINSVEVGNEEFVDFFISKGANDFIRALEYAALSGNLNMVKKFSNYPITDTAIEWGIVSGNFDVVRILTEHVDMDVVLKFASKYGKKEIVEWAYEKGARQLNGALNEASYVLQDRTEIIDFLINKGANQLVTALNLAAYAGNLENVKLLIQRGANDFSYAMKNAEKEGHFDVLYYLKNGAKPDID